jgi:hypothetical protein
VGFHFLLGAWLVYLLNDLEGQDYVGDLIGLPVPNQLHLSLVLKEQELIFVWQGLPCFDEADDFLNFLFCELSLLNVRARREVDKGE